MSPEAGALLTLGGAVIGTLIARARIRQRDARLGRWALKAGVPAHTVPPTCADLDASRTR